MDRNIDEKFRKPRQTRGTPLHTTRNYYFLGLVGLSGVIWYLWELWPQTEKLKQSIAEGKFDYSAEMRQRINLIRMNNSGPSMEAIFEKVKKNLEEKEKQEENPRPQSRLNKVLNSWFLNPE